ncbi:1,4-alpha-glucan (glycogen) branching enzyme,GH-13-type [Pseudoalteromonas luteoviolacea B = ATCC 29581]|nr:1,4-alpha-glucan (glycogen) branching enzyme,GH-13-type [Pseudoalteromonas luteoviolacea B = ATCC 29581]
MTNTAVMIPECETTKQTLDALANARCSDPFAFLGVHQVNHRQCIVRVYLPTAIKVDFVFGDKLFKSTQISKSALFCALIPNELASAPYKLQVDYGSACIDVVDPYQFNSTLHEQDLYLFNEGNLENSYRLLGAHIIELDGILGCRFSVWAPNAKAVSVIGHFNGWNKTAHPMRLHPASGIWELFIPDVGKDEAYKYAIFTNEHKHLEKADPYAFKMEQSPGTASLVQPLVPVKIRDEKWFEGRKAANAVDAPIAIYEVHLGSWKRRELEGNRYLTYREMADDLIPYVKSLGFTHLQVMPISEYPFDGSWGYQPVGLFAPTSRFGSVEDFSYFVDACHDSGLGLIIDWVPGHFPSDPQGLHQFDGTHLYEHADARQGFHPDWNTYIYNYDRPEVQSYLLANALFWLKEFHIDGLRVDAVASMLYLDYSRKEGEWIPNCFGGRENLGAIACLKKVNARSYANCGHVMMVAEESTAWPGVTAPTEFNGLGFGFKWNMGWMNDTLSYMKRDPVHRKYHHHEITFSMAYAYSENYILPLSHDEVVHGKGALLSKMPGDDWQQFANLRAYYAFMYAHPGKKLLFMGSELAQREEWAHDTQLNWDLLESKPHRANFELIKTLNTLYCQVPALYENDTKPGGFKWIDCQNAEQSILSFVRFGKSALENVVVIANFTPTVHHGFRLGVPNAGVYEVILNTDNEKFYGSGISVVGSKQQLVKTNSIDSHGFEHSIEISIGPLSTIYLRKVAG